MGYISDGTYADNRVEMPAAWRCETIRRLFGHPDTGKAGYKLRAWATEILRVIEQDVEAPEVKILPRERGRWVIHLFWSHEGRELTMALVRPGELRWIADVPDYRPRYGSGEVIRGRPEWINDIRALVGCVFRQRSDCLSLPESVLAQIGGRW